MKYIVAAFIFLAFNASWLWWVLFGIFFAAELILMIGKFRQEYKKQVQIIDTSTKPITKQQLEEVWNNGYAVGVEHSQIKKH